MSDVFLEEQSREYIEITDGSQMSYIVDKYMPNKKVYIKGVSQQIIADIEIIDDTKVSLFIRELPRGYKVRDEVRVYTVVNRYIEIKLKKIVFTPDGKGIFEFSSARIANAARKEPRIKVSTNPDFWAENFRFGKYYIGPFMKEIPICVQVAFDSVRSTLEQNFSGASLDILNDENKKEKEVKAIKKFLQPIYIADCLDEDSYYPIDENYLNYANFLGDSLYTEISYFRKANIKSILVYPIKYLNLIGEKVPVGYIKLTSAEDAISLDIISEIEEKIVNPINDKIRDANVALIKTPQQVNNVSKSGLQVNIKNKEIMDTILSSRNEIALDVRPKAAFRFALQVRIVSILVGSDNDYNVGMKLLGGEQTRGLKQWQKYIDKLLINGEVE